MRDRKRLAWVSVVLGALLVLSGCSALRLAPAPEEPAAPRSDGMLVSGRYTTKQGTMRWQMEFNVHADGSVTHVLSVEGTDRFADFWRERYQQISSNGASELTFEKVEEQDRTQVRASRIFPSAQVLNESGMASLQVLDSPLFRSLVFKTETGSYDADSMVSTYGNPEQATAEDWATFLRDAVTVTFVVHDEVTGQTYRWNKTAGEIGTGVPVVLQGKQWHTGAYLGATGVGLFLLFVLYMGIFGRRHWAPEE